MRWRNSTRSEAAFARLPLPLRRPQLSFTIAARYLTTSTEETKRTQIKHAFKFYDLGKRLVTVSLVSRAVKVVAAIAFRLILGLALPSYSSLSAFQDFDRLLMLNK